MTEIRYLQAADKDFWYSLDRHLPEAEFDHKVRTQRGYVLLEDGSPAGILRYNLFWDNTPFCTLLLIHPSHRKKRFGTALMAHWEADMKAQGYDLLLTSTQTDEDAQHFYRKLGFKDCGGLILDIPGHAQPMELFLIKDIRSAQI